MHNYTKKFSQIGISDVPTVGGKNASLGEMFSKLSDNDIKVPDGFATTAAAFDIFLDRNELREKLKTVLSSLNTQDYSNLKEIGGKARSLILSGQMPKDLSDNILQEYHELLKGNEHISVAVRSSATAEDLPNASFAGQHESYLNIKGDLEVLKAVQQCYASLYTDRAIKYRNDKGFEHEKVLISVGIQRMVRADLGCSGVGFTLEPESGFKDVIHLAGVWGLGENIVQGTVNPDEYILFKITLKENKNAILQKRLGSKKMKMVYAEPDENGNTTANIGTTQEEQNQFVLSNQEIMQLGKWAMIIEQHYKKPMDIEWAKDGETNELFIIQARPETVHSNKDPYKIKEYSLAEKGERIISGLAVGSKAVSGVARLISSPHDSDQLKEGEILVTDLTSPDWDPVLKKSAAIITNKGGRTSHASIVARELDVPAIVGTSYATEKIKEGQLITVSCSEGKTGYVYDGALEIKETEFDISKIELPKKTKPMLMLGDPDKAFQISFYPNEGIGLMRLEFTINQFIGVHPMALIKFDEIKNDEIKNKIEKLTRNYPDKTNYFIDKLSQGIATIAAAFYPREVIVRMSDFKTNEYAALLGGKDFEPEERNPMLGFRGASRYYHESYREGFKLECTAIKIVREEMGLTNVKMMIPFCRTIEEAKKVQEVMKESGLARGENGLELYMMTEIPSNVILAKEFAELFDGFSIGSNDLTQLVLGVDRDSAIIAPLFDEQNQAVTNMISKVITDAHQAGIKVGLCGQAPSDYPEFAQFLVQQGIDSISFNPDALIKGIENIVKAE